MKKKKQVLISYDEPVALRENLKNQKPEGGYETIHPCTEPEISIDSETKTFFYISVPKDYYKGFKYNFFWQQDKNKMIRMVQFEWEGLSSRGIDIFNEHVEVVVMRCNYPLYPAQYYFTVNIFKDIHYIFQNQAPVYSHQFFRLENFNSKK